MFFKTVGTIMGITTGYHWDKAFKNAALRGACALINGYIGINTLLQLQDPESTLSILAGPMRETTGYGTAFALIGNSLGIIIKGLKNCLSPSEQNLNTQEETSRSEKLKIN